MTLLKEMADYQQPPVIGNQPMKKLAKTVGSMDYEKFKRRLEGYRSRHCDMVVNSEVTVQAQYQHSQEQTKVYHEKWQQVKAKKSNKRQRDSSGSVTANNNKRKLSTTKTEGPSNKKASTENTGDPEPEKDSELEEFLNDWNGLDIPTDSNNLNDIISMLESESSNTSIPDSSEKTESNPPNGIYPGAHQTVPTNNDRGTKATAQPQQPIRQQTPQQPSHTPSPQTLQAHNGATLQQQQVPAGYIGSAAQPTTRQMPSAAERMAPVTTQFNRSISESASVMAMRQQQMNRQISMPVGHNNKAAYYNAAYVKSPNQMVPASLPQGISMAPDYGRQMSVHNPPAGSIPGQYYPNQMPPTVANRDYHPVAGYHGYSASQYAHPNRPMTAEELHRLKAMKASQSLARSNSHSSMVAPGHYMDTRQVAHPGAYYPNDSSAAAAAAMQQQAALREGTLRHPATGPQMMPAESLPSMPPRTSFPSGLPTTGGVNSSHMLHRQMSAHEQQLIHSTKAVPNMQHTAGLLHPAAPNTFPSSEHVMPPVAPPYPPTHMRSMSTTNPTAAASMIPQHHHHHHHSSAQLMHPQQQQMSRAAAAAAQQGQNPMMNTATHPTMNHHLMHRPPSNGTHPHQLPHTTSPPQPQQAMTPQPQSYYMTHQQTMQHAQQQQLHQRGIHPQHNSMHPQQSIALAQQQNPPPHPQHALKPNSDSNHQTADLDDLDLILSTSQ